MSIFDDFLEKSNRQASDEAGEWGTFDGFFNGFGEEAVAEAPSENQPQTFEQIRQAYQRAIYQKALSMAGSSDFNDADVRFSGTLNLNRIRQALVVVIGAGGLGNWQWRILASMGFRRIAIYDDDVVGIENVGPQAHSVFDIGLPKVEAVQNAAMAYRGIKVIALNKRVHTMSEIVNDLGETPNIVIGCTDSAGFRNTFITTTRAIGDSSCMPELFLDYRMSLGDWVGFIIPFRRIVQTLNSGARSVFYRKYNDAAVFPPEEGLQEPCTERAISYTGASVASFTGAVLHWFYSRGRAELGDEDYLMKYLGLKTDTGRKTNFAWKVSFSSRDFEFITKTYLEVKLREKIDKERDRAEDLEFWIKSLTGIPGVSDRELLWKGAVGNPSDAVFINSMLEKYRGCLVHSFANGENGLITSEGVYAVDVRGSVRTDVEKLGFDFGYSGDVKHFAILGPNESSIEFMASKPLGTVFKDVSTDTDRFPDRFYKWDKDAFYIVTRDGETGKLEASRFDICDDAVNSLVNNSNGVSVIRVTNADDMAAVMESIARIERITFRPVAKSDVKEGMRIATKADPNAARYVVRGVGPNLLVNEVGCPPDDTFYLTGRVTSHLFEVVGDTEGEAGSDGDSSGDGDGSHLARNPGSGRETLEEARGVVNGREETIERLRSRLRTGNLLDAVTVAVNSNGDMVARVGGEEFPVATYSLDSCLRELQENGVAVEEAACGG